MILVEIGKLRKVIFSGVYLLVEIKFKVGYLLLLYMSGAGRRGMDGYYIYLIGIY